VAWWPVRGETDKSAFRKKIAEFDFLEPVASEKRPASNRPAQIYGIKRGSKRPSSIARSERRATILLQAEHGFPAWQRSWG
jgi:hypothetical protein